MIAGLANEIHELRQKKQDLVEHNSERQTQRIRTSEMLDFLDTQSFLILKYDDSLVRKFVESVKVFENKLVVVFKSGMEIEVDR